MSERPTFEPIWLACKQCGYRWDDWQPWGVSVAAWAAHVCTLRCPHCGAAGNSVLLRTKPIEGDGG